MNKKDQKAKESNDKQKSEDAKTERSVEKTSNTNNNKKEKSNQNNSILDTQPQINNKINNAKKENGNLKSNLNNDKENNIKKAHEPTPEDHENANAFLKYIDESGLPEAFQLIFAELISKKINPQNYYSYVGMRLKQIGKETQDLQDN